MVDTKYAEVKQLESKPFALDADQMTLIQKNVENYYGVKLGTYVYDRILKRTLLKDLERALASEDLFTEDLRTCAQAYLERIGRSEEEVTGLKEKLS